MSRAKIEFFKVRVSRAIRGTFKSLKDKFKKDHVDAVDDLFGDEEHRPLREVDREKKTKSTIVVLVTGIAMGVSHTVALSSKYGIKPTKKTTIITGLLSGAVMAYVWYNHVDAAEDDIHEEDIEMMFEMMSSSGFGDIDKEDFERENGKALDILHVIITGREYEEDDSISIDYEEEDDEDRTRDNAFLNKADVREDNRIKDSGSPFGRSKSIGISRPLTSRTSLVPDEDDDEDDEDFGDIRDKPREGWLDIG